MLPLPAIDLKNGECVRLFQGDMAKSVIFNKDPLAQASDFFTQGFTNLHVVDLDRAVSGNKHNNTAIIKQIIKSTGAKVQVGGGIRTMADIDEIITVGAERVILGTAAITRPELVYSASAKYPGRIIIAVDSLDGYIATNGWVNQSEITPLQLAKKFENIGVAALLYTDISKDGTMAGVNLNATIKLAETTSIPIIASGGVGKLDDVKKLLTLTSTKLAGIVIGRALYEGAIVPEQLFELLSQNEQIHG